MSSNIFHSHALSNATRLRSHHQVTVVLIRYTGLDNMYRLHEPNQQVEGLRPAWGSFDSTSLQTYVSDMVWSLRCTL